MCPGCSRLRSRRGPRRAPAGQRHGLAELCQCTAAIGEGPSWTWDACGALMSVSRSEVVLGSIKAPSDSLRRFQKSHVDRRRPHLKRGILSQEIIRTSLTTASDVDAIVSHTLLMEHFMLQDFKVDCPLILPVFTKRHPRLRGQTLEQWLLRCKSTVKRRK